MQGIDTGEQGPELGRHGAGWWPSRSGPHGPMRRQARGQGAAPRPRPQASVGQRGRGQGQAPEKGKDKGKGPRPSGEILFFAYTLSGSEPTSQEDIFGVEAATSAVRRLTDHSSGMPFVSDRDPAWSPDRSQMVFMSGDAAAPMHLPVLSAAGAPVADLAVEGTTPVWLDGATVVCSVHRLGADGVWDRADLVAVDVPSGAVHPLTAVASGHYLGEPAWHPSSGLGATLSVYDPVTMSFEDQHLVLADPTSVTATLAGGPALTVSDFVDIAPGHQWGAGPAWSPDGSLLAFSATRPCATAGPDGTAVLQMDVAMLTLATGTVEWVTDDTSGDYDDGLNDGSPAFSPDGRWLAWVRGHEDDWTRIMVKRLNHPSEAKVLLNGQQWFRWGLAW